MKAFFDTSVLIPVFVGDHLHHEASKKLFLSFQPKQAGCGAHALAEVYSSLTRMPGSSRVPPDVAMMIVDDIRARLNIVALTANEYYGCLSTNSKQGIVGGTIYDAVLAQAALKANAKLIYTWNLRHYSLLGPEITKRLRTP